MRKVVVIKDMSAGNDNVGEMWKETRIFSSDEPIENILKWAMDKSDEYSRKQITITVPFIEHPTPTEIDKALRNPASCDDTLCEPQDAKE